MNRHAYLIMAHSQIDILKELLKSIDDERNDVFLHIDKKFLSAEDWDSLHMEKSNLQMIPPMSVNWGGYSQVECTLRLMEAARSKEHYHYYHFMTGVTYPLRNQDEIHRFFQKHEGSLFLNFDSKSEMFYDRVRYLWFLNELNYNYENANTYPWYKERLCWLNKKLVSCQKLLHYDHFKQFNLVYKKGLSYWSLPDTCISYLLEQRPLIRSAFQYSSPGDESFVQTLVYNSPLYADVFQWKDSEYDGLVTTTWSMEDRGIQRKGHAFIREDLDYLKTCRYLFARKLSGPEGYEMIQEIKKSCY